MILTRPRVLVIDDEPNIRELLRMYLGKEGYEVQEAHDGREGLDAFAARAPSLVILDVMMPRLDGLEVCRAIRAQSAVPIIMLTARGEEVDKILDLEICADDYLTKPFSPRELPARVRAVLRRSAFQGAAGPAAGSALLASHPQRAFSREELLQKVWDYEYLGDGRTVDVHIRHLREKIEPDPKQPRYIHTVWGTGYRFDAGD